MDDTIFARLMCDLMVSEAMAKALRDQGFDVAEARTLPDDVQQDDRLLLQLAARERRVLVTCNCGDPKGNFRAIHEEWQEQGREHAGIILIPQEDLSGRMSRWQVRARLVSFLDARTWDELHNQLFWLP